MLEANRCRSISALLLKDEEQGFASSKKQPDTRTRILDVAEELIQTRGYNAFSYQHISGPLGMRNAAIHYHFPSKEELGCAVIARFRERFESWVEALEKSESDPSRRFRAFVQIYLDCLDHNGRVCMGGILGAEFASIPEEMKEEARWLMREMHGWLIEQLQIGRDRGVFTFAGGAEDKALQIGAALQGALQIARIAGRDRFAQVLRQIEIDLQDQAQERSVQ